MRHWLRTLVVLRARRWHSPRSLCASAGVRERQQRGPVRDPLPAEGDGEPDPVAAELRGECRGCHRRANQPCQVCSTPALLWGRRGRRRVLLRGEGDAADIGQEQRGAGRVAAFLFASLPGFLNSGGFSPPLCPALSLTLLPSPVTRAVCVGMQTRGRTLAQGWAALGAWGCLSEQTHRSHPGQNTGTCRGVAVPGVCWGLPTGAAPPPARALSEGDHPEEEGAFALRTGNAVLWSPGGPSPSQQPSTWH